jgi:hypothetical protein
MSIRPHLNAFLMSVGHYGLPRPVNRLDGVAAEVSD